MYKVGVSVIELGIVIVIVRYSYIIVIVLESHIN